MCLTSVMALPGSYSCLNVINVVRVSNDAHRAVPHQQQRLMSVIALLQALSGITVVNVVVV